jgi:hypothetical protein
LLAQLAAVILLRQVECLLKLLRLEQCLLILLLVVAVNLLAMMQSKSWQWL